MVLFVANPSILVAQLQSYYLYFVRVYQGCQIFHDLIYQNGEKDTKSPLNNEMAIKYTKWP
jgi:hypothetical protein